MITILNEIILVGGVMGFGWIYNNRKTKEAGMHHSHNALVLEKSNECAHQWKIYKVREFRTEAAKKAEVSDLTYDIYNHYSYISEMMDDFNIEDFSNMLSTNHPDNGEFIQVTTQICCKCGELRHSTFRTSL